MAMSAACLDDDKAQAFVASALPEPARREVEEHVDECEACRQLLVALVRTAPAPATRWREGDRVARYRVVAAAGRGGMGEVYRADDVELARPVALKRLRADVDDADGRARLVREARAAAQLQHPNVVGVYEVVDDGDVPVLVTEWIDGVTLREWLGQREHTWRERLAIVVGAGRGLAAAHAAGIVHRDFKPDNVLVGRDGRARVADFGLAGRIDAHAGVRTPTGEALLVTVTGSLSGTPAYLAPELIDGGRPDARSDQYAFAVTLFEALYGVHPFAGGNAQTMWAEMAQGRIRQVRRRGPAWLDRCVRRALAVEPADRWPDLDSLLAYVDRRSRRATSAWLAGGVAAVAIAGAAAIWAATPAKVACGDALADELWHSSGAYHAQFAAVAGAAQRRDARVDRSVARALDRRVAARSSRGVRRRGRAAASAHELSRSRARRIARAARDVGARRCRRG